MTALAFHMLFVVDVATEILKLFVFMARIQPMLPGEELSSVRYEIAHACVMATSNETERFICAKIPRFESQYREDVLRCRKKGSAGEVTAWQILPRGKDDAERLCRSVDEDAVVAIERIRESRRACHHLPTAEQLALYTRGNCASDEGKKLSRIRWPYAQETRQ